jgi:hypothetical protein
MSVRTSRKEKESGVRTKNLMNEIVKRSEVRTDKQSGRRRQGALEFKEQVLKYKSSVT